MAIALTAYNTLTLDVSTAVELTLPGGTFSVSILNLGPGNLFLKGDSTVGETDSASYELPVNLGLTVLTSGPLWILADAAGRCSVALIPRP